MAKPPIKINERELANALIDFGGNLRQCAQRLGCSYGTVVKWVNDNPLCKETRRDVACDLVTMAESNLWDFVEQGDRTATLYVLNNLAKHKYNTSLTEIESAVPESKIEFILDESEVIDE